MSTVELDGSGDVPGVRLQPFKTVTRPSVPFSYLPRDSAWDQSTGPWKPFLYPLAKQPPFGSDTTFVKVYEEQQGKKATSHLAAVVHVQRNLWCLCKLDKTVRMRDIRALSSLKSSSPAEDESLAMSQTATPDDLLATLEVSPSWLLNPDIDVDMSIPSATPRKAPELPQDTHPADFLAGRYFESLYATNAPLVYFAKSTMSRIRSQCADQMDQLAQTLSSRLLQVHSLDAKYEKLASTDGSLDGLASEEHPHCEQWMQHVHSAVGRNNPEMLRQYVNELKVRETQLQIIILLELLVAQTAQGTEPAGTSPPAQPKRQLKTGIVRKKRDKKKKQEQTKAQDDANHAGTALSPETSLDVLFDRLCIHQAINGQAPRSKHDRESPDKIQEFCLDVVLHFFGSRLPEKTKEMVKKARGLATKSRKAERASSEPRPGQERGDTPGSDMEIAGSEPVVQRLGSSGPEPPPLVKQPSMRGGFTTSSSSQQRRQVEVTFAARKHQRDDSLATELSTAIRNIAKPNRNSVADELAMSRPVIQPKRRKQSIRPEARAPSSQVQVAAAPGVMATPAKKRTIALPQFQAPVSPVQVFSTPRKTNYTEPGSVATSPSVISTPVSTRPVRLFVASSPVAIMATPVRPSREPNYDTDDDETSLDYNPDDLMMH